MEVSLSVTPACARFARYQQNNVKDTDKQQRGPRNAS